MMPLILKTAKENLEIIFPDYNKQREELLFFV